MHLSALSVFDNNVKLEQNSIIKKFRVTFVMSVKTE